MYILSNNQNVYILKYHIMCHNKILKKFKVI